MDTPRQPMVVTILLVLAEPLAEGRLREVLNRRLLLFARFRQRLVREGGRHVWIEDAAFDLSHHVEWRRLPEPADQRALAALVGEVASQSLVAGRPLWRCVVVENAGSGCALLFRVHHCVADGIALLRVFLTLTDRTPHPDEMPAARAISLEEQRDQARLAAKTAKAPKLFSSGLARLRWGGALLGGFFAATPGDPGNPYCVAGEAERPEAHGLVGVDPSGRHHAHSPALGRAGERRDADRGDRCAGPLSAGTGRRAARTDGAAGGAGQSAALSGRN
jgi:hypothetical protein